MIRFLSWLVIGVAAAFLVAATAAFSLFTITWLAFAISIGTLVVSAAVAYGYRHDAATAVIGIATAVVSMWTIVATRVLSQTTVQNLALGSALGIAALAIAGLAVHELWSEHAVARSAATTDGHEPRLATAA